MLPGWCCIAIATLEPVNGDSWYHMCAFRFYFWGRKVNWNQASHVRACSVPNLDAFCLRNAVVFLFGRVGLCCWFCDFAVSFLVPPEANVAWNVSYINVFIPAWMVPPMYHSLRREEIKCRNSRTAMGVKSIRPTWFEDETAAKTTAEPMHGHASSSKRTSCPSVDKAHLRGIWVASERRYGFYRFTLDPFSPCLTMFNFNFPFATWQCHCWLLDGVQESVRMLPARLALCDLEAPGWGEPRFPHCAFVASWLTDCCMAFSCFCWFALVFLCHTNPRGDTMLSSLLIRFRCLWTDQLITGRAVFGCV